RLPACAQLAQEQHQPEPDQEVLVVDHPRREARVLDLAYPGGQLGQEVAHGAGQDGADVQGRPPRRRRWGTRPRARARVIWLTSHSSALRRRYAATHVRPSSRRSWGTYTVRVLPPCLQVRWWAWCSGPPWWQAHDGCPQRLFTSARLAASTGPVG